MTVRGYQLGVDWFDVGDPAGMGEDDTSDVTGDDLVISWGRDTTQAGSQPAAGQFGFVLRNDTRRYSTNNVSSPLYGLVLPGRRVQLTHTLSGQTVKLFDGILDTGTADTTAKTFTAECLDSWGRPAGEQLSTAVYQGIRTGDAVNIILDAIGWTGGRDIDPGATVMPWWWEEGTDAATAIEKLVDSEGPPSIAYVAGGVFVFEDRFHRLLTAASTISNGLFSQIIPAGSGPAGDFKILKDSFTYDDGIKRVVNSVSFTVDQRVIAEPVEVWVSEAPLLVPAGGSLTVFVSANDPFVNAQIPFEDSGIAGLGAGGIRSNSGVVAASLSRTSGQSTIVTLTSPVNSVVWRLAITAQPVTVARSVKVSAEDTSSVGTFGRATWPKSVPWANVYDAQALCDRIVATYARARPVVSFDIAGLDATYMAQIRGRRISDRITIHNDEAGVNDDFVIEKLTHTIRKLGLGGTSDHRLSVVAEVPPVAQPINVFTFDDADKGFNDGLFGTTGIDNAEQLFMFDAPIVQPLLGSFGARLDGGSYSGIGTHWNDAVPHWNSITGISLPVTRWYNGPADFTIGTDLTQLVAAGVRICLTLKPDYNPVSSTHLASIASMLSTLQASGADVNITLWHEPFFSGLSAAQYTAMVQYYGPTVRTYYPLWCVFSGSDTNLANGYYPGAAYCDGVAVDHYVASSFTDFTNCEAMADVDRKPFGVWEFNGGADLGSPSPPVGQNQATVTARFQLIQQHMTDRVATGKPNGDVLFFSSPGGSTGTRNWLGDALSQDGGFEGGIGNWSPGGGCSIALSTLHANSGSSCLGITATGVGNMNASEFAISAGNLSSFGLPCVAGQTVMGSAWFLAPTTGRTCIAVLRFYNAAGTQISSVSGGAINDVAVSWTYAQNSTTVPVGAVYAVLWLQVNGPVVLGEVHYADDPQIAVLPATNDLTSAIQYPWDYRIPLLAAMQTVQVASQGFDTGRFGT